MLFIDTTPLDQPHTGATHMWTMDSQAGPRRVTYCDYARAVLKNPDPFFFVLRTAPRDHQPPTAATRQTPTATNRQPPTLNRQPPAPANHQLPTTTNPQPPSPNCQPTPTTNCQPPTATNRQPPIFEVKRSHDHEAESVPVNVRFCWRYEPFSFFPLKDSPGLCRAFAVTCEEFFYGSLSTDPN